jgi:maleylpyruvate isomerase
MAAVVTCDIHPLNNLRVLNCLRKDLGADETQVSIWIACWIAEGFAALERMVDQHGKGFAYGDTPTLADICLVPQLYSAMRFGVDLSAFPRLEQAGVAARALTAFVVSAPEAQMDADA